MPTHGKWVTYSNGCRCESCRYAWTLHRREERGHENFAEQMCPRCGRWYQAQRAHGLPGSGLGIHETHCAQRDRMFW